jgi:hypothetical protein
MSHVSHQDYATELPAVTIGLDLGDRTSRVYEVSATGARLQEASVATTPQALAKYFGQRPRCRVVLEVGTHSPWVSRELARWGHEVVVANPSAAYGRKRRPKGRVMGNCLRTLRASRTIVLTPLIRTIISLPEELYRSEERSARSGGSGRVRSVTLRSLASGRCQPTAAMPGPITLGRVRPAPEQCDDRRPIDILGGEAYLFPRDSMGTLE